MNFLSKVIPWYVYVALALASVSVGALGIYRWGYNNAETSYRVEVEKQKAKIKELEAREAVVKTEVVTVYKDRVRTVVQVQEKIVEVTRDVLGNEVNDCRIGPGFIRLHNAAATNQTIPRSPK